MSMSNETNSLLNMEIEPVKPPVITDKTIFHVGVSGGKDSVGALIWMVHCSGIDKNKVVASFCDIGNDHQWTIEHVKRISETVHPIEVIKPDFKDVDSKLSGPMDFMSLVMHKRRFPGAKARFCTEYLKIWPTQRHIQHMQRSGLDVIAVSGVRADESDERSKLLEWDYSGSLFCYQWRPLIAWSLEDVKALHEKHEVPLNPLYAIGARRVGCWPCVMSRKSEIRTIALKFPERIDEIRKAEERFESEFGWYGSFFPAATIPERFRTKPFKDKTGKWVNVATIDDVVRWSMTGDRAKGHYTDNEEKEPVSCKSGYCE